MVCAAFRAGPAGLAGGVSKRCPGPSVEPFRGPHSAQQPAGGCRKSPTTSGCVLEPPELGAPCTGELSRTPCSAARPRVGTAPSLTSPAATVPWRAQIPATTPSSRTPNKASCAPRWRTVSDTSPPSLPWESSAEPWPHQVSAVRCREAVARGQGWAVGRPRCHLESGSWGDLQVRWEAEVPT